MKQLIEVIKQVALAAVREDKPTEIVFGTVVTAQPLTVRLSQKRILGPDYLVVRAPCEIQCPGEGCAPHCQCDVYQPGDKLILLRFQGGQRYLIFGKEGTL